MKFSHLRNTITAPCSLVLMYHRIDSRESDPWQLSVSISNFEQQLSVLKKRYTVLSLQQFYEQIYRGKLKKNSVLLTFDDTYSDNYFNAKPLLEKYECPATFFVPSAYINQRTNFWWDELELIMLHTGELPEELSVSSDNQTHKFRLKPKLLTNEERENQKQWKWPDNPPNERCELYLKIWELLKILPYEKIEIAMQQIRQWKNHKEKIDEFACPMTLAQLKEINNHKLFTLGIHTHTHPALASHSLLYQENEITQCKIFLKQHFAIDANTIAYPYGDYNEDTIAVARKTGLNIGFTTNPEPVTKKSNPFQLGRYQVLDWSGKEFKEKLDIWFKRK